MKGKLQATGLAGGIAALIAISVIMTTWGPATSATPKFATTHAEPSVTRVHALDHTDYKVTLTRLSDSGKVLSQQKFAASTLAGATRKAVDKGSGTGGESDCFGVTKVIITAIGRSTLGFKLYHAGVWIKWSYDCILHRVYKQDTGRFQGSDDQMWEAKGWVSAGLNSYFEWQSGHPKSGYVRAGKAEFTGPCITINTTCHAYPRAELRAHASGTNAWETDAS